MTSKTKQELYHELALKAKDPSIPLDEVIAFANEHELVFAPLDYLVPDEYEDKWESSNDWSSSSCSDY
jgi:hypothetical protein